MSQTAKNLRTYVGAFIKAHWKWLIVVLLALLLGMCVGCTEAQAQTITVTASQPTSPSDVKVTWSGFQGTCVASEGWSGAKASSGTQTIPGVTGAEPKFTLTCSTNNGTARVGWTPPTQNVDGSAITDLVGFRIKYGTTPSNLFQSVLVSDPAASSYAIESLAAGTWYFNVVAMNRQNIDSDPSSTGTKTIAGTSVTRTASVKLGTKPKPPTGITVVEVAAYDVKFDYRRFRYVLNRQVGSVPVGTACKKDFQISGGYARVERWAVDLTRNTSSLLVVAKCG